MRDLLLIGSIEFVAADSALVATGLLGFVSLRYGELDLDGSPSGALGTGGTCCPSPSIDVGAGTYCSLSGRRVRTRASRSRRSSSPSCEPGGWSRDR